MISALGSGSVCASCGKAVAGPRFIWPSTWGLIGVLFPIWRTGKRKSVYGTWKVIAAAFDRTLAQLVSRL